MLQILVGILIIALIVLAIIFFYQRRINTVVKELDHQLQNFDADRLAKELAKNRLEGLMGESLKKFTELRQEYDENFVGTYQEAQKLVKTIQTNLHGTSVFSTNQQVNQLRSLVTTLTNVQENLQRQIQQLDQAVKAQENAIKELRQQYNQFGRTLDEKSFDYGESKNELQNRLVNLEKKYEHFADIARKGDHEAAQELLNDLEERTAAFKHLMEEIPSLYRPLYAVFPDQLKELQSGYQQLVDQGYHFTEDDIDQQVEKLEKERQMALKKLTNLNVAPVKNANQKLTQEIDRLYELMQKELDAKPFVEKTQPKLTAHLAHAQKQNQTLMTELQRLSNSYTLNNDEISDTRQLDEQLKDIDKQCQDDQKMLQKHLAIFSEVWQRQQDIEKSLSEIEQQQKTINDGVAGLQEDEQRAQKALQRFVTDIRTTKRRVENLNLPGIPQDYLDYFFVVSDEISKLSTAMNQPQINMEDITKQLLIVQEDLETLHDKTDNLRDSAALTERMIQYANRLSTTNETIDASIQKAQSLFDRHEYSAALETIGTALEETEAGSFKRLEKDYYEQMKD
ncbi:septation ring formation regulator EzrA [uncultured Limosilactobacillus sp.]|uniref:septation ring formation regulator EzrA n=1 Tax=uncultured Limosilactobacillus sp. TaxID=2837629 RepID=UPI0025E68877|nr:septation ring formation regulator EzrA [uncultured Limosilactobacillus sp.]